MPTQSELDDDDNEKDNFRIESYSVDGHTDRSDLDVKIDVVKMSPSPRPLNMGTPKMKAIMVSDNLPNK